MGVYVVKFAQSFAGPMKNACTATVTPKYCKARLHLNTVKQGTSTRTMTMVVRTIIIANIIVYQPIYFISS